VFALSYFSVATAFLSHSAFMPVTNPMHRVRLSHTLAAVVGLTSVWAIAQPRTELLLLKLNFAQLNCDSRKVSIQAIARASPDGHLHWVAPVPTWFMPRAAECEISPWVKVWHEPEQRGYDYENLGMYFVRTAGNLVFATSGGMFALHASDGKLQFEWVTNKTSEDSYSFDAGHFEVHRGGTILCTGKADGARVFTSCKNYIVFFDGHLAAVLDASSGKVISETAWRKNFRDSSSTIPNQLARIPLGNLQLVLRGMVFVR